MRQIAVREPIASRRTIVVGPLNDATDMVTPETGEAGGQPQISKNAGVFGNTTAVLTAIDAAATALGYYALVLAEADLDTPGELTLRYKSAATWEYREKITVGPPAFKHFGTAQGGGANTVQFDAGASAVDDFYNGDFVVLVDGTGEFQAGYVDDYVGATKQATMERAWGTQPVAGTVFMVFHGSPKVDVAAEIWDTVRASHVTTGTFGEGMNVAAIAGSTTAATRQKQALDGVIPGAAVAGTLSTTQMTCDIAAPADADHYKDRWLVWRTGNLAGQGRQITASADVGGTLRLTFAATTQAPVATDEFVIV